MKSSDKNKISEPLPPENTPDPPQVVDPNQQNKNKENHKPGNKQQDDKKNKQPQKDTGKRLGESPIEIDDETTI
jgi:hypothetical protein